MEIHGPEFWRVCLPGVYCRGFRRSLETKPWTTY